MSSVIVTLHGKNGTKDGKPFSKTVELKEKVSYNDVMSHISKELDRIKGIYK